MTIDDATAAAAIASTIFGLACYIRYLHGKQMEMSALQLLECKEATRLCEARSSAQQGQIDALIDGDRDRAKASRDSDVMLTAIRTSLGIVCLLFMSSCGLRLSEGQAQQLSQARANVVASRISTDLDATNALLRAAAARQMAAVADLELPEPMTVSSALVAADGTPNDAAIATEIKAAALSESDPPSGWASSALAWAGGTGLLVLGALRFSPGLFGAAANIAHQFLAPLATRQMRERQQQGAQIAEQAIAYGAAVTDAARAAGLGEEIRDIQLAAAEVQDRLGIREQTKAILAQFKNPTPIRETGNSG